MKWTIIISMILFVVITEHLVKGQELLFKNFARLNRASRGPDEFEKFFLKASKSVPRIGRRDFETEKNGHYCLTSMYNNEDNSRAGPCWRILNKKFDPSAKDFWYNLADTVEYNPEILMSPAFLANAGFKEMDFVEKKRTENTPGTEKNKEITEYRLQPDS